MTKIFGALTCLKIITKAFTETEKEKASIVMNDLIPNCFPILSGLFKYLLSQNSENFSTLRHLILKIFYNALLALDIPLFLKKKENFDDWMNLFMESMKLEVPKESSYESPFWKNYKWLTHILYRIFVLFENFTNS
jgi:hypothetical protein